MLTNFHVVARARRVWVKLADGREFECDRISGTSFSDVALLKIRTTKGEPYSHPLSEMMLHLVNHGTYHRGQVTAMLRQLGAKPLATDLILFYRQGSV